MFNRGFVDALIHRDPLASFTPELQFADKPHTINVMFLGCDSDWDPTSRTIHALSVPRDTAVHIPQRGYNKINAAHALGGPELTKETVKSVFGIDVDYYMTLNFDGFMKVVDALGGVDINVQKKLDYDDNWGNLHVHLKPGFQHMNGYHAMGYVRIRHSDDDIQRTARQQDFLEALRSRIKSPANLLRLPNALNAVTDSVKTDMTQEQMITVANFARLLDRKNVEVGTLPVTEGPSYVYIKRMEDAAIIRKFFYDDDRFAEVAVNAPGEDIVARLSRKAKHKRHGKHAITVDGPQDDDGQPLLSKKTRRPGEKKTNTPPPPKTPCGRRAAPPRARRPGPPHARPPTKNPTTAAAGRGGGGGGMAATKARLRPQPRSAIKALAQPTQAKNDVIGQSLFQVTFGLSPAQIIGGALYSGRVQPAVMVAASDFKQ
ncbi:uncharacterized protein KY384_008067 [Bacidia gigantensis]|uniref:uncharacterized protein n=1 Tax=Bacidia gigantensis TaxID=2732470 RepID=UPI001D0458C1|nr:uncharacterized protein KY384_008067 [Bacidia gigantensis]KAG8526638.1 hypothetical protein KY384_008067 [Bacidia gigantensis]